MMTLSFTTQEAFLRAIHDNPRDDVPRLVYADWLEETQGSPRAQFIRLQCAFARGVVDEQLARQVAALLEQHGRQWAADDLGIKPHILPPEIVFEFHRGFAWWHVTASHVLLKDAIAAGRYDYVNDKHFKLEGEIVVDTELVLYHPDCSIKSDDVVKELDQMGLRPATLQELCAFGKNYPDIQREFPVVALGSVYVNSSGYRLVPFLVSWRAERKLSMFCWHDGWRPYDRFLAART